MSLGLRPSRPSPSVFPSLDGGTRWRLQRIGPLLDIFNGGASLFHPPAPKMISQSKAYVIFRGRSGEKQIAKSRVNWTKNKE